MCEFTPFKKTDSIKIDSYIKFPRELSIKEEYKGLTPSAMLLYTFLIDRLELSFQQIEKNSRINFYDEQGKMYVILKRDEAGKLLHLKRSGIDNAFALLKKYNLIEEKCQGRNLPNVIYVGKTIGMIEAEKIVKIRTAKTQHSRMSNFNNPECKNPALQYNKNNINNNIYNKGNRQTKANFEQRHYEEGELDFLYAN